MIMNTKRGKAMGSGKNIFVFGKYRLEVRCTYGFSIA
jgi:hypothetical protein